ncbi:MAG: YqgE/AlgH family protein [Sphingobacteriales bacterium]|nr:YqgE/AlgH family protein [Sphingobacteriales bacterium]MBI3720804.1 YqgE/AlgH family protein [Sphingobacteriales bacterium]
MQSLSGHIIQATSAMDDPVFKGASIFITEHNEKGAIGFVFNKPSGRHLNELEEFKHCKPTPLYDGGPMDKEHIFFVHIRPDLIEEGTSIGNSIYSGGNFSQAIADLNEGSISTNQIKLFIGYCGWNTNELETEIAEGSWQVTNTPPQEVFKSF